MSDYNFSEIEPKWQDRWEKAAAYKTSTDFKKPKYYILDMFPYPSGAGLHVGHPEGYTATDVIARMKRMQGFNVLHPMGWDAFGLPAERAAERENIHPAIITKRNVDNFRKQIKRLGFSYDWEREIDTSSSEYYRWTQWIFLKLYQKGLAYLAEVPVNWCPALGTVLANEEVKDGKYVETGDVVEKRMMKQWMLRITAYADRLIDDLDTLDWPDGVKDMQRFWIGKSTGAEITFEVKKNPESTRVEPAETFTVFTTRPDTLFGATYCVLSPEHPLVAKITTVVEKSKVEAYVNEAKNKSELARTDLSKEKSGAFTGAYAVHPVTGKDIPIWVADYVLMSYGTGAIMAVPAHDERDHAFAAKFQIPIVTVVKPRLHGREARPHTRAESVANDQGNEVSDQPISGDRTPSANQASVTEPAEVFAEDGVACNSDFLNGLETAAAKEKMAAWLETNKKGKKKIQFRLRDWLFSRQRYWGEPFPIVHLENGEIVPLDEKNLPIELPPIDEFRPTADGRPPLARAGESWLKVKLPDGRIGHMETNTMPQWAGSCWYYLRYIDARNQKEAWSVEAEKYWMPVDLYVGGVEHAVLHLLYARFWHKVLFDLGLVHTKEPFQKLFNQGMILAHSYRDSKGKYYPPHDAEEKNGRWVLKGTDEVLERQIEKMSKSKYNVVNPDDVIAEYGADSMRLYELFMGPLDMVKPWQMDGVEGVFRFLGRVWRMAVDVSSGSLHTKITNAPGSSEPALWKLLHKTVKKVAEDTAVLHFNTAISQMMILVNEVYTSKTLPRESLEIFLKILSPYAPHVAEEIWEKLGHKTLLVLEKWPVADPALCVDDTATIVFQVNGKMRGKAEVDKNAGKDELLRIALTDESVAKWTNGKEILKQIVVPGKLVNLVVKEN